MSLVCFFMLVLVLWNLKNSVGVLVSVRFE